MVNATENNVSVAEAATNPSAGCSKAHSRVVDLLAKLSIKEDRVAGTVSDNLIQSLSQALQSKTADTREAAVQSVAALCDAEGRPAAPQLLALLPVVLDLVGDRVVSIQKTAEAAARSLASLCSGYGIKVLLPILFAGLDKSTRWQTKRAVLNIMAMLAESSPHQMSHCLPEIIPHVSDVMWDTKPEVQQTAKDTMTAVCATVGNPDIVPFLPDLINCIAHPENVPECVYKLAATTFVTTVEAPTLAIMTPLLGRALSERKPAVLRQAVVIINNMCKLVENPAHAQQFLPQLLPGVDRIIETGADPELRQVASNARATLIRVGGDKSELATVASVPIDEAINILKSNLSAVAPKAASAISEATISFVASLTTVFYDVRCFNLEQWIGATSPYLQRHLDTAQLRSLNQAILDHYVEMDKKRQREALGYEDEEGEELCNCEFSLAYGGMILLSNTRLRLLRGQRYGLCGPNGSGKTTLMRAINKGQVEGFPSPDVLRTVFVEHDLQGSDGTESVLDFVASDSKLSDKKREEIASALASVGFTAERQANTVSSLSGGWKMKLELARAMLYNADILLLDEPTNHLDVTNVQWLVDYLNGLKNVTSIIVSHDSGFLDKVCTNIVHYESRKLKQYKGNLSEFVKVRPEAKSYYELSNTQLTFRFPEPGFLDGVKTKEKAILRMTNCTFTYPGASQPSVKNVSIHASLSSRVGVVGPNGAGKSTIIKLFTGELVPQVGEIIRHPALRLAYVAQHAFHHIESKLDMTANQYIQWRYRYGEDREVALKESRQLTEEDEALLKKPILVEGEKRFFESLEGRRKDKRSYEYEVKWLNRPTEENTWMSRDKLESLGYSKILQQCDDREVARAGMYQRPLTAVNVQKHLADVGLEPEFSTHNRMRGLSGGQKVKVVIGAAMWQNPHILIMDEPTNYLDRDSLGALASAIKEFAGGVVIISHNAEFVRETCKEIWNVDHGVLSREGEAPVADKTVIEVKEQETVTDALGNVSKVKSTRTLSRKELKAKEKRRAQRRKAGLPSDSEEDAEDF